MGQQNHIGKRDYVTISRTTGETQGHEFGITGRVVDDCDNSNTDGTQATGEFRLAWLYAEGWRQQLKRGSEIVENNRWEWGPVLETRNSFSLSTTRGSVGSLTPKPILRRPRGRKLGMGMARKRKSVHWAL